MSARFFVLIMILSCLTTTAWAADPFDRTCMANKKVIEGAMEMFEMDGTGSANMDTLINEGYLRAMPQCRGGVGYRIQSREIICLFHDQGAVPAAEPTETAADPEPEEVDHEAAVPATETPSSQPAVSESPGDAETCQKFLQKLALGFAQRFEAVAAIRPLSMQALVDEGMMKRIPHCPCDDQTALTITRSNAVGTSRAEGQGQYSSIQINIFCSLHGSSTQVTPEKRSRD